MPSGILFAEACEVGTCWQLALDLAREAEKLQLRPTATGWQDEVFCQARLTINQTIMIHNVYDVVLCIARILVR